MDLWNPPPIGSYKVNWDVALDHHNNNMEYGYIVRDSNDTVVAVACHSVRFLQEGLVWKIGTGSNVKI